ncbi:MAG: NAD(P)/FAD-dependent oxidoreductase [Rubripirellula sp.]
MSTQASPAVPRHVVIIGGGFGGLETAKRLRKADVQVTLVDRRNFHLFQPLLYQVATGGLSPANIATPLRSILRRQANCEVLLAEVTDFDIQGKRLILADGELAYDKLVVAAGATHSYFGNDEWEKFAPGLKTIQDATTIRRQVFLAFEAAERERDAKVRERMMTFVVVGGGPTGVELAGALSEIARHTLKHDFRHIRPADARILIVEAAPHVLAHYPEDLCNRAAEKIRSLGIEVHTKTKVTDITEDHVRLISGGQEKVIPTQTVLWAAGVHGNPLGQKLADACGLTTDRAGRIGVTDRLNVSGQDDIFVIGDLADCTDGDGVRMPGLAPVAIQQGQYLAKRFQASISGREFPDKFVYRDRGTMATIGRAKAVAQIGKREMVGFFAWVMWLVIHLMQIVQFQNRLLILFQWGWNYITFNRSARIITGEDRVILVHDSPVRGDDTAPGDHMYQSDETGQGDSPPADVGTHEGQA